MRKYAKRITAAMMIVAVVAIAVGAGLFFALGGQEQSVTIQEQSKVGSETSVDTESTNTVQTEAENEVEVNVELRSEENMVEPGIVIGREVALVLIGLCAGLGLLWARERYKRPGNSVR